MFNVLPKRRRKQFIRDVIAMIGKAASSADCSLHLDLPIAVTVVGDNFAIDAKISGVSIEEDGMTVHTVATSARQLDE